MGVYFGGRHGCFQCSVVSSKVATIFCPGTRPSTQRRLFLLTAAWAPSRTSHIHPFSCAGRIVDHPGVPERAGVFELDPLLLTTLSVPPLLSPPPPPQPALLQVGRHVLGSVLWPQCGVAGCPRSLSVIGVGPMVLTECPLNPTVLLWFPHQQK